MLNIQTSEIIWGLDWHPFKPLIAVVGSSKHLTIYQLQSGQIVKKQSLLTQHNKTLRDVKFSHSGKFIAVASFDSTISIYALTQGEYDFMTSLQGHDNEVKCISWSKNDKKIASCSRDKSSNVWIWQFDETSYDFVCQNILEGHTQDVKCVIWLDQFSLASSSYDNSIRIWMQNDDDFQQFQVLNEHKSIVWNLNYSQKDHRLYSLSEDSSLICWERNTKSLKFSVIYSIQKISSQAIYSGCLLRDQIMVCFSGDNLLNILDLQKKVLKKKLFVGCDINSCRMSQNQGFLCFGGDNGRLFVVDITKMII